MYLKNLTILNYKNIREANLTFASKMNCFIGLNGQGKTNILDAVYYLSFTKSAFTAIDSQTITHNEQFAMIQGLYDNATPSAHLSSPSFLTTDEPAEMPSEEADTFQVSCALRRGLKKQFRYGKKSYERLHDHIGVIPLVMVSPSDAELIIEGSDIRRRFADGVISQYNRHYLSALTDYNALLAQRNALLKQCDGAADRLPHDVMDIIEEKMSALDILIFEERTHFIERFIPYFRRVYNNIAQGAETVDINYKSQLQNRDIRTSLRDTRPRDVILGWTSQGIHKDDMEMICDAYPLKQVASQGQQKTCILAMKFAQALFLVNEGLPKPILLLDDIFDKLDAERVERIVELLHSDDFGQIFVTDTDRQHISTILSHHKEYSMIFNVAAGEVQPLPLD